MRCSLAEKGIDMAKEPDKLAQDVSKAIAAGMSYGNWKAMQYKPVKVGKKIPDGWLVCQYCGKPFKPKTRRLQLYCEAGCQVEAQKERDRAKGSQYKKEWRAKQKERGAEDVQSENVRNE